ncbi:MAG: RNA-binding S4 domain-containing protein [Bacteroidota bacterium]
MKELNKVRIDKWLWSVRIFKSRTLATDACKSGEVRINDKTVKASYMLTRGETIIVKKGGFNLTFEVVDLLEKRVSAPLAQVCYIDHTSEEEMNKYKDWFIGKGAAEIREKGEGRPTKKQRRTIDKFKGNG